MEMVWWNLVMALIIKDNFSLERCMDKESIFGQIQAIGM